jgi:hypothetical protein
MCPIVAQFGNWTISYILRSILDQAQSRGCVRQVAKGLFAGKLEMLLKRELRDEEISSVSTSGDFLVGDAVFVLAITLSLGEVVDQVRKLLRRRRRIVWVIVRQDDSPHWENVFNGALKPKPRARVVVSDIESNIGMTILMMAGCQFDKECALLADLIRRYNYQQPVVSECRVTIAQNANLRSD